jgi:hypothetical protein
MPPHADPPDPLDPDAELDGAPDATLGGYFREHERPPAFEGADGEPYTVSPEAERTPDLANPWEGYLVFPRWARTGVGVVGHVESGPLVQARTREDALRELGRLSLARVRQVLDQAIAEAAARLGDTGPDPAPAPTFDSENP